MATQADALDIEVKKLEDDLGIKLDAFKERDCYRLLDNNGGAVPVPAFKLKQHAKNIKFGDKVSDVSWIDEQHIAVSGQSKGTGVVVYNVFAKDSASRTFYSKDTWLNCVEFKKDTVRTDHAKIAYGGLDNEITVVDFQHKSILENPDAELSKTSTEKIFQKHGGPINDISWCPGTNVFASASGDNSIMLWSLDQPNSVVKEPEMTFRGHQADVNSLTWLDTNVLLSGSGDSTCRMFDRRIGGAGIVQTFAGHEDGVSAVCAMNNNRSFASCSEDQTVRVWDIRAKSWFATHGDTVEDGVGKSAMSLSKSGRMAFVGNDAGSIDCIDLLTGDSNNVSNNFHKARVTSCELAVTGNALATSSRDSPVDSTGSPPSFAIWA